MADEITPARLDAAAALRDLAHAVSAHDADDPALGRVADAARDLRARVEQASRRRRRRIPAFGDLALESPPPDGDQTMAMADRAVAGPANPTAVDLAVRREGDEAVARVRFGAAFEGAPGRVHGGMVAAVFDDVTGFVLAFVREPAFTGQLSVTYRAPVPVDQDVEFRARLRAREGRRLFVDSEARLGDGLLADAEATFVVVDQGHFATHASELLDPGTP